MFSTPENSSQRLISFTLNSRGIEAGVVEKSLMFNEVDVMIDLCFIFFAFYRMEWERKAKKLYKRALLKMVLQKRNKNPELETTRRTWYNSKFMLHFCKFVIHDALDIDLFVDPFSPHPIKWTSNGLISIANLNAK